MKNQADFQNLSKKERRQLKKQQKEKEKEQDRQKKQLTKLLLWFLGILVVIGGFFLVKRSAGISPQLPDLETSSISPADHVKGNPEAGNVLIEYSDLQCPACQAYHPLIEKLTAEYPEEIAVVYRHFPLNQHKNAKPAAYAAEAAGRQDKFWEMTALIFQNQNSWAESSQARDNFVSYARELDLDQEAFLQDLDSEQVKNKVENDYLSGVQTNVRATPTFFFNGNKITNPKNYEDFVKLFKED